MKQILCFMLLLPSPTGNSPCQLMMQAPASPILIQHSQVRERMMDGLSLRWSLTGSPLGCFHQLNNLLMLSLVPELYSLCSYPAMKVEQVDTDDDFNRTRYCCSTGNDGARVAKSSYRAYEIKSCVSSIQRWIKLGCHGRKPVAAAVLVLAHCKDTQHFRSASLLESRPCSFGTWGFFLRLLFAVSLGPAGPLKNTYFGNKFRHGLQANSEHLSRN